MGQKPQEENEYQRERERHSNVEENSLEITLQKGHELSSAEVTS